jgi:alkanesulfonate monooxygenase SsuD/methylene tetrahydromethanopterin reductase-like flavin-dependent oxidoreductase (luciferase family)
VKVGPILILGEDEERGAPRSYRELRELALSAEAAGVDTVWVYDHLLYHFEGKEPQGVWECWTVWSALAEATSRVELGALVLCTAFRNPAVLAKMAVTLDEVSDGRVILGIGAGWNKPEFDAFGLDFERKVDQFEEQVNIIAPLVREGRVDFQGEFHQANNCLMVPAPKRNIPLLIAAKQPRMLRLTARHADLYNTAWHGHVDSIEERVTALHQACEQEGRDPETIDITVGVNVAFTDLEAPPEGSDDPQKYITGTVAEVAEAFRAYQERGVAQLIATVSPHTPAGMQALGQAAQLARGRERKWEIGDRK